MQKNPNPCINTGEFARLCNTNKRTLLYYDEIGLFRPAFTDENGYRYYSENQCDLFFTIRCLQEIGMPLKEIRSYIDHRSPEALQQLLGQQKLKVQQELETARCHFNMAEDSDLIDCCIHQLTALEKRQNYLLRLKL